MTIARKEEGEWGGRGGRLRSRYAQTAIRETLGGMGGPRTVMAPALRPTSTLTEVARDSRSPPGMRTLPTASAGGGWWMCTQSLPCAPC